MIKYTVEEVKRKIEIKEKQGFDYCKIEAFLDNLRYCESLSAKDFKILKLYLLEKYFS